MSCEMHESMIVSLLFPEKVNMKYASAVHTIIHLHPIDRYRI
jgi:hypothetical protein